MAASNRYSQITPSQFNPLSLEEVMMVPLMKRQQHDAFNKQLSDAQLKVDPLKVHEDEALQLQRDFEAKKLKYAEQLMREGVNPNSSSEFLKFNREYQDLISPMGRVGKINQAKILRDAERARYLEAASKQYGSTQALDLWNKYEKEYTGYEDPEKSKIKFIDSKGIVAAQNFDEDLKNYHSLLGEIQSSTAGSGYRIVDSGLGDGSKIMVNSSGQTIHSDNIDTLNELRKVLDSKWLQETGEGYKFNVEAGINLDNFKNRFDSAINMQKKKSDISKSDVSANFINGGGSGDEEVKDPMIYSHSAETQPVGDDYKKIVSEANSVLNNPKATVAEKNLARQKLDLIDDIKQDLNENDKGFKERSKYTHSVENSKFMADLIVKAEKEKSPYLKHLKSLQQKIKNGKLTDVASPNMFFAKGIEIDGIHYGAERLGKYAKELDNFFGKHIKNYNNYKKQNIESINSKVSQRGLEKTSFTHDYKNEAEKNTIALNLKDALTPDIVKASTAYYTDSDGTQTNIPMDDGSAKEVIRLLNSSENKNIDSRQVSRVGNTIGVTVSFRPNEGTAVDPSGLLNKVNFNGSESIEVFIPIGKVGDEMTGFLHTGQRVFNQLPKGMQHEVRKMIGTANYSSTSQKSRLGMNSSNINEVLPGKFNENDKIDFLKNKDKTVTPHVIDNNNKSTPLKWNQVIDYNSLNDKNYLQKLSDSGFADNIINFYQITTGKEPIITNNQYNFSKMFEEIKNLNVKLPRTSDILEIKNLNN